MLDSFSIGTAGKARGRDRGGYRRGGGGVPSLRSNDESDIDRLVDD